MAVPKRFIKKLSKKALLSFYSSFGKMKKKKRRIKIEFKKL
jgi:hypothetical protein